MTVTAPREVLDATMRAMQCNRVHDGFNTGLWYCDRHQLGWLRDRGCCPHAEVAADAAYTVSAAALRAERNRAQIQLDLVRAVFRRALGAYEGGGHSKLGSCLYTIEAILSESPPETKANALETQ